MDNTIEHLEEAVSTWNAKLAEAVELITTSPVNFRDGEIYNIMENIHTVMVGIATPLLVLCFFIGIFRVSSNITEMKRPELAIAMFVRAAVAEYFVVNSLTLMLDFMNIGQSLISDIFGAINIGSDQFTLTVPTEIHEAFEGMNWVERIGPWVVSLLGSIAVTIAALFVIITIYGRFFKIYIYMVISPLPIATLSAKSTSRIGESFLRSYAGVCLEGAIIMLALIIYTLIMTTSPTLTQGGNASKLMWEYLTQTLLGMILLVMFVKSSSTFVREMFGL